jgi:hypothetical protein
MRRLTFFVFIAAVGFGMLGNSLRLLYRLNNHQTQASVSVAPYKSVYGYEANAELHGEKSRFLNLPRLGAVHV